MTNEHSGEGATTRRDVLRGIAGGGAGLVVAGGATGTVAAGSGDDCELSEDIPRIDTSNHLDTTWYGSVYHEDEYEKDAYEEVGDDLPDGPDELLVHVHGWQQGETCGAARIEATADTYEAVDYDSPVTGLTWGSDYSWWNAKEIAEKNAPKLAAFLRDIAEDNPETTIRLQAFSLGARVIAETLLDFHESDDEDDKSLVTSVVFLAGAIDNESVAVDGKYGEALENAVDHVENYWMEDDTALNWGYQTLEFSAALGNDGCDGEPPESYTDHKITKDLDHGDHYEDEDIIEDVVNTFDD